MKRYTVNKTIKLTELQSDTLNKLKTKYKVNPQKFIRDAIAEKIKRDYNKITAKPKKVYCP